MNPGLMAAEAMPASYCSSARKKKKTTQITKGPPKSVKSKLPGCGGEGGLRHTVLLFESAEYMGGWVGGWGWMGG